MAIELKATRIKVNARSPELFKSNLYNYEDTGTVEKDAREPVWRVLRGLDVLACWDSEIIPW